MVQEKEDRTISDKSILIGCIVGIGVVISALRTRGAVLIAPLLILAEGVGIPLPKVTWQEAKNEAYASDYCAPSYSPCARPYTYERYRYYYCTTRYNCYGYPYRYRTYAYRYRKVYNDTKFVGVPLVQVPTYSFGYPPHQPLPAAYVPNPAVAGPVAAPAAQAMPAAPVAQPPAAAAVVDPCTQRLVALQARIDLLTKGLQDCQRALQEAKHPLPKADEKEPPKERTREDADEEDEEPEDRPADREAPAKKSDRRVPKRPKEEYKEEERQAQDDDFGGKGDKREAEPRDEHKPLTFEIPIVPGVYRAMAKEIESGAMPPKDNKEDIKGFSNEEKQYVLAILRMGATGRDARTPLFHNLMASRCVACHGEVKPVKSKSGRALTYFKTVEP